MRIILRKLLLKNDETLFISNAPRLYILTNSRIHFNALSMNFPLDGDNKNRDFIASTTAAVFPNDRVMCIMDKS